MKSYLYLMPLVLLGVAPCQSASARVHQSLWTFDRLSRIGGLVPHVEGTPRLIPTPVGRATLFDGKGDALFFDTHPLAGAKAFTFEAIFRPDGGAFAQRWFHLAEAGVGSPSATRILFEIRIVPGNRWYLDAFATGQGYKQTLIAPDKTFPVGRWYHVAQSYDGKTYRSYVNGQLQVEADMAFAPQGSGHASVGTRINRVDYFQGAIRAARFTDRALAPRAFMALPTALNR